MGDAATSSLGALPGAASLAIGGMAPSTVIVPGTAAAAAAALADARRAGQAVVPWGAGTAQAIGALPLRYDVACLTSAMASVIEYEPDDLVVSVGAGISLGALQDELRPHGQFLAIDGIDLRATIGGIVATNRSGPSRLLYGTARDLVLGVAAALPNGDVVRSGGRVVKNVVGYDLNKLHVGGLGTLGLLCEVTLKVHPLPRAEASVVARFESIGAANDAALALARSNLALRAVDVLGRPEEAGEPSGASIVAWCSGWPAAVDRQADEASATLRAAGATGLEKLAGAAHAAFRPGVEALRQRPVRLKLAVPPASLGSLHESVARLSRDAGTGDASWVGRAGVGIAHLGLDRVDAPSLAAVRRVAEGLGGTCVIEDAPSALRSPDQAWGRTRDDFRIMSRIRDEFDPTRTINPGRFVGGL